MFRVLVYCSVFLFFVGCGVSLPRWLWWFIPWVAGGILDDGWCSPVGLPDVSQAGLGLVSNSVRSLLFSQCNTSLRSCVQAGSSGCQNFDSWCFISAKCGFSISVRFLICRAHALCFCTLVAILDNILKRMFLPS
jgi:hypothetical protein